jgi:hypothetical protein
MRSLVIPSVLGVALTVVVLLSILGAGRMVGRDPGIPWSCDDTRYVDTVPAGRGVVGPALSAPPGCGGQGS